MSLSLVRALFSKRRSVSEDWIAWLPPDKIELFKAISTRWDRVLAMSGVALEEAFELRRRGRFERAIQHVQMVSELVTRNSAEFERAVQVIYNEARHVGDLPTVEPLDPTNFHSEAAQEVAHWNTFFHWVLFDARTQFFQKLRVLERVMNETSSSFAAFSEELMESNAMDLDSNWQMLACLECDLNTCARELQVVLKAFLRNLPAALTAAVRESLEAPLLLAPERDRARKSRVSIQA